LIPLDPHSELSLPVDFLPPIDCVFPLTVRCHWISFFIHCFSLWAPEEKPPLPFESPVLTLSPSDRGASSLRINFWKSLSIRSLSTPAEVFSLLLFSSPPPFFFFFLSSQPYLGHSSSLFQKLKTRGLLDGTPNLRDFPLSPLLSLSFFLPLQRPLSPIPKLKFGGR